MKFSAAGFPWALRDFKLEKRINWVVESEAIVRDAVVASSHRTKARVRPRDLLLRKHQDNLLDS